jgi:hypothetical protein
MRPRTAAVTLVLLAALSGCSRPVKPPPAPEAPPTPVATLKAADLLNEYKSNELAADGKYKGKLIQVTGKFASVQKDLIGRYYVSMEGGSDADFNVACYLSESGKDEAAKLQANQDLTVRGVCDGRLAGQVLTLKQCEIVKQ